MTLLRMSMQGGLLILGILLLRAIALQKLPKTTFPVLWALATARMLLPFSFPWRWSLFGMFRGLMPATRKGAAGAGNRVTLLLDGLAAQQPGVRGGQSASALPPALRTVWLVGASVLAVGFALWLWKTYAQLRVAIPIEEQAHIDAWRAAHPLRRPLRIMQSDRIRTPLAVGVLRPRILLPKGMPLDDAQTLGYVLSHEYFHIRRFDMLWKLLTLCAVCVHWFNPLVWLMLALSNRDLELGCDALVLRHYGGGADTKKAYACALIAMAERRGRLSPIGSPFSRNAAKERIVSIMKYKKSSVWALLAAAVLVLVLTTAFAIGGNNTQARTPDQAVRDADKAAHYAELVDADGTVIYKSPVTDGERYTPAQVGDASFPSEEIPCLGGVSGPHTEANARMAIYTNNGGAWDLKAGQTVTLSFDVAETWNEGTGWSIYLGYGTEDGSYQVCANPRIHSGITTLSLTVPEDGAYRLFFVNVSAGAVYVNRCELAVG